MLSTINNSEHLFSTYIQNEEKLNKMEKVCCLIDDFSQELNASHLSFEIDEDSLDFSFYITCPEIFASGLDNDFYKLLDVAKSVSFNYKDNDNIIICFVFEGVWDLA